MINKIIDPNRVVYKCIRCNYHFIEDINFDTSGFCPGRCGNKGQIVICTDLAIKLDKPIENKKKPKSQLKKLKKVKHESDKL